MVSTVLTGKFHQHGAQHGGREHGQDVLETQQDHLPKGGVIWQITHHFCFCSCHNLPSFSSRNKIGRLQFLITQTIALRATSLTTTSFSTDVIEIQEIKLYVCYDTEVAYMFIA